MIRTIRYTSPDDLQFRERSDNSDVTALVRGILEDVRQNGDAALYAYRQRSTRRSPPSTRRSSTSCAKRKRTSPPSTDIRSKTASPSTTRTA